MSKPNQDLAAALRTAADDVECGASDPHHMGAAAGVPPWLLTILQLVGPSILAAVQQWLSTVIPTPPTPKPSA